MKIFARISAGLLWAFILIILIFALAALGVPFTAGNFHGSGYQFISDYGMKYSVSSLDHSNFFWFYPPSDDVSYSEVSFVGNLLMVILVVVPVLSIFAIFVSVKLNKAVKRPYSIEYIDARKEAKKTAKSYRKTIKKAKKMLNHKEISSKDFHKLQKEWDNKLKQSQLTFEREHKLFLIKYNLIK